MIKGSPLIHSRNDSLLSIKYLSSQPLVFLSEIYSGFAKDPRPFSAKFGHRYSYDFDSRFPNITLRKPTTLLCILAVALTILDSSTSTHDDRNLRQEDIQTCFSYVHDKLRNNTEQVGEVRIKYYTESHVIRLD